MAEWVDRAGHLGWGICVETAACTLKHGPARRGLCDVLDASALGESLGLVESHK
jgi:hypothetical protein